MVARCYPPDYGWFVLYEGWGNGPLTSAYNDAKNRPGCVFNVSPKSLPIFTSPFPLFLSNTHVTGFDFAKAPYSTLNVADFGHEGSAKATVVDNFGRDRSGLGFLDGHDAHDVLLERNTSLLAVANGTVLKARSWLSPCSGSDSALQQEVWIKHQVVGASGYSETFVSYYAHLSDIYVKDGDSVSEGQLIGLSGNTGCSSDPHLHFGVVRLSNTADALLETLYFFDPPMHSNKDDKMIDPYGFTPPEGFDPWAWRAYPSGALSLNLWKAGQAPSRGDW